MTAKQKYRAVVLGASGFAGAELLRRLLYHPGIEVTRVCAVDHVGQLVESAHPHLSGLSDLRFENPPPAEAVRGADIVLMGLPHDASVDVMRALPEHTRVIDMSGAFRLKSAASYAQYYGVKHSAEDLLGRFVYGLPELFRDEIRAARCVASPGCFATTIELGLAPFARAGLLSGSVHTVGITGSSGAGAAPLPTTHHPVRANNLRTYRPLTHQHTPEIEETLIALDQHTPEIEETLIALGARSLEFSFVPVSAPLTRGIFATSFFTVPASSDATELERFVRDFFAKERFVRVPRERLPEVVAVAGSNYAEVGVAVGPATSTGRSVSVMSALDNLIKGGAGQAIQNMNLMLGFDEHLTLEDPGPYP
jgi:LysW-gamma-L-alpha-aminoadipyl-6-phosphate/LysW-L-glutamyl-5-phosphate reductase